MTENVGEILIRGDQIAARVRELVRLLVPVYAGRKPVFVAIMDGCRAFAADLVREWPDPVSVECISARSYDGTIPGKLTVTVPRDLGPKVAGRPVLLIDDIYDTGRTLVTARRRVEALHPAEIRTLVFLRKRHRARRSARGARAREALGRPDPDWVGFEIEDRFVVGYGLDFRERYRDLPYIAVLEETP